MPISKPKAKKDRSVSRGRDFRSSGRGGAGNIRRTATSQGPQSPTSPTSPAIRDPDLTIPVRGREISVDPGDDKAAAVGRGGHGNIQNRTRALASSKIPEHLPHAASVIHEIMANRAEHERIVVEASANSAKLVHKSGRGGSGNIAKTPKVGKHHRSSFGRPDSTYSTSSRGSRSSFASVAIQGDNASLHPGDFESLRISADGEGRGSIDTLRRPDDKNSMSGPSSPTSSRKRSQSRERFAKFFNKIGRRHSGASQNSQNSYEDDLRNAAETATITGTEQDEAEPPSPEWLGPRRAGVVSKQRMLAEKRQAILLAGQLDNNASSYTLGQPIPKSPHASSLSIATDTYYTNRDSSMLSLPSSCTSVDSFTSPISPSDTSASLLSGTSPSDVMDVLDLCAPSPSSERSLPLIIYPSSSSASSTSDASSSRSRSWSTSSSGSTSSLAYLQDMMSDYSGEANDDHLSVGDSGSFKSRLSGSVSVRSLPTVHEMILEENEFVSFLDFE